MATEKTINTRIQLKYSTLAEWSDVSTAGKGGLLVLKSGEVGIVAIPKNSSHLQTTPPAIMFKVGDGATPFKDLPWASALAADVYAWAKKSAPAVEDFNDIIAAARDGLISADSVVKTLNELKGDITIAAATGETHITVAKDGQKITFALTLTNAEKAALASGITSTKVTKYDGYEEKITEAKTAADNAQTTANGKYSKPTGGIPKTDLAAAVQTSLDKADTAIQSHQTITTGSTNGTIAVAGTDVAVKGLAALAYKASLSKSDVGLGSVENKGLDTAVTSGSGNYITSGAVKTAIDNAISGVTQFDIIKYDSFDELPATGKKGVIYIIAHSHSDSNDSYDEYIWNTALETPAYEKIGNTDVNLTNYVNGISGTTNNGVVTNITKNGNTITVTSKSLATTVEAGDSIAFIKSVSQAADGKITAHKQNVPSATQTAAGLMTAADKKKLDGIAEGANKYVLPVATGSALGGVKAGTTNGKVYGVQVASDGAMTVNVPWTDTNTDHNQTVKVGEVTFGEDTAVELVAGTNVTVVAETVDGANKIHINGKSDDAINSLITTKINSLDVSNITGFGAGKTLKTLTETDGKIAATFQDISITASQVSDFNAKIEAAPGYNKTGTVTSVSAGTGLKITGTASTTPKVEIDDSVVFVFNCGSATELVD